MDKTSEKVTKDPKHVEAVRKGREKYMNKLKESTLNDAKKGGGDIPVQAMKLPRLPTLPTALTTPPPQDQMILMFMGLVCLLSLPLVFVYFLQILKNKPMITWRLSMSKKKINHQNDVICFRKNIQ